MSIRGPSYLERGFTLIELVVVIAILGLIAAAILPRFTDFRSKSTASVTQSLAGSLRVASTQAHLQCVLLADLCNPRSGTYFITVEGRTFRLWNGYVDAGDTIGGVEIDMLVNSQDFTVSLSGNRLTKWVHPMAVDPATCYVTYTEAQIVGGEPVITADTSGC